MNQFDEFEGARIPRVLGDSAPAATVVLGKLTHAQLDALVSKSERRMLRRGDILVRHGEPSEELYFVLSGRFGVQSEGTSELIAEIGQGQPIGEMGFFAALPRTATVIALRDSIVLAINRHQFQQVGDAMPDIRDTVIAALAHRLVESLDSIEASQTAGKPRPPRTVAVIWAGATRPSQRFLDLLENVFRPRSRSLFLTPAQLPVKPQETLFNDSAVATWLNAAELENDFIFYIADDVLTDWTRLCVRQADAVLLVASATTSSELNASEEFALSVLKPSSRRLVLLHESRGLLASGTTRWLEARDVSLHHHVAVQDTADIARLYRFLSGRAVGFVAGGGGSLGAAHLGVYKAFSEAGIDFDIFGGTSAGAAMTASLASGTVVEIIDKHIEWLVNRHAFSRPTVPRYGLLNHHILDGVLQDEFRDLLIEDLWRPFFAISANLSTNGAMIHRDGLLWQAVRASSSIPGVFPPFFTKRGEMLVDGCIMENVPLASMKMLKSGPNVVVALSTDRPQTYDVEYTAIPGPRNLLTAMLNPFAHRTLPQVPNVLQVIVRSMMANRKNELPLTNTDMLIEAVLPPDVNWARWERHTDMLRCAYDGATATLKQAAERADSGLAAIRSALS